MKDREICQYINCPYYLFYKKIKMDGRCYNVGPCIKIKDIKYRWKISPMSRPGVWFTEEEMKSIKDFLNEDRLYEAQKEILDCLDVKLNEK